MRQVTANPAIRYTTAAVLAKGGSESVGTDAEGARIALSQRVGRAPAEMVLSEILLAVLMVPIEALPVTVATAIHAIKYFAFFWSLIVLFKIRRLKVGNLQPLLLLFCSVLISCALNWTGLYESVRFLYGIFSGVVLTKYIINYRGNRFVTFISACFTGLIVAQAITAALSVAGIEYHTIDNSSYFLGMRITFTDTFIFALSIDLINHFLSNNRLSKLILLVCLISGIYFILVEKSTLSITTTVIWLALMLLSNFIHSKRIWKLFILTIIVLAIGFNILMVNMVFVNYFVARFLNEGPTFGGRFFVWSQAISRLQGWHWLFGHGFNNGLMFELENEGFAETAHSQYLEVLFRFGLIGLIGYLAMLIKQFGNSLVISNYRIRSAIVACTLTIILNGIVNTTYYSLYVYLFYIIVAQLAIRKECGCKAS